jgi:hypothetical protein
VDPHPLTATELNAVFEFSDFLKVGGGFVDHCPKGKPCYAQGWAGP